MNAWGTKIQAGFGWVISVALVLPVVTIIATAFNSGSSMAFPPDGWSWRWFEAFVHNRGFVDAAVASIEIGFVAALLSVIVGTPAAVWVSRTSGRIGMAMESFLLSPLMLATIVLGVGLLEVLVLAGIPTSPLAISLGHTVIGTPYVARLVLASLAGAPRDCERAARSLGAPPIRAFLTITFPLCRSGVIAGGLFALLISLDDVNIALFLSDVHTTTLPVATLSYIEQNADPLAAAVSAAMVVAVMIFLIIADRIFGIDRMFGLVESE